jgi:hypothetical protein
MDLSKKFTDRHRKMVARFLILSVLLLPRPSGSSPWMPQRRYRNPRLPSLAGMFL